MAQHYLDPAIQPRTMCKYSTCTWCMSEMVTFLCHNIFTSDLKKIYKKILKIRNFWLYLASLGLLKRSRSKFERKINWSQNTIKLCLYFSVGSKTEARGETPEGEGIVFSYSGEFVSRLQKVLLSRSVVLLALACLTLSFCDVNQRLDNNYY